MSIKLFLKLYANKTVFFHLMILWCSYRTIRSTQCVMLFKKSIQPQNVHFFDLFAFNLQGYCFNWLCWNCVYFKANCLHVAQSFLLINISCNISWSISLLLYSRKVLKMNNLLLFSSNSVSPFTRMCFKGIFSSVITVVCALVSQLDYFNLPLCWQPCPENDLHGWSWTGRFLHFSWILGYVMPI